MPEKIKGLVLKETVGAVRSTPAAHLGALLDDGPIKNTISVAAAQAFYRINNAQGAKLVKRNGLSEFRSEEIQGMPSDRTLQIFLFEKRYKIYSLCTEDYWTSTIQLPSMETPSAKVHTKKEN